MINQLSENNALNGSQLATVPESQVQYAYLMQNALMNSLNRLGPYSLLKADNGPKGSKVSKLHGVISIKKDNLLVSIPNYIKLIEEGKTQGMKTSTYKLLDIIGLWLNQHKNSRDIQIPLKEYMSLCRLSDEKEVRKQVRSDLEILSVLSIGYEKAVGQKMKGDYRDMRIIEKKEVKNGLIKIHLAQNFSEMLRRSPVMPYPLALLKIRSDKFPNAPYILRKMVEQKNMNRMKPNENTISVKTLLNACPLIPDISAVRGSSNRSQRERIIMPFLRDLLEACQKIDIGGYSLILKKNMKKEEVSEERLRGLPYETIVNDCFVHFQMNWPGYPQKKERESDAFSYHKRCADKAKFRNKGVGPTPKEG